MFQYGGFEQCSDVVFPFDGGTLPNEASGIFWIPVPILGDGTLPRIGTLPDDPILCGLPISHQVMFVDPGAAGHYKLAQTAGLRRTFGY